MDAGEVPYSIKILGENAIKRRRPQLSTDRKEVFPSDWIDEHFG